MPHAILDSPYLPEYSRDLAERAMLKSAARWVASVALSHDRSDALRLFEELHPRDLNRDLILKAATAPASTSLLPLPVQLETALGRRIGAESAVAKLDLRRVPFDTRVLDALNAARPRWAGQGAAKPVVALDTSASAVPRTKAACIVVATAELLRAVGERENAEAAVEQTLVAGMSEFLDEQFTDPTVAAVPDVNPASITSGLVAVVVSGTVGEQLAQLVSAFFAGRPKARRPRLLLGTVGASGAAMAGVSLSGGAIFGLPYVVSPSLGTRAVVLDADAVLLADDGRTELDLSRHASLEMDDAPAGGASMVPLSLWQQNLVAVRVERFIHWLRIEDSAVQHATLARVAP
jgi:hypothetical protein